MVTLLIEYPKIGDSDDCGEDDNDDQLAVREDCFPIFIVVGFQINFGVDLNVF